jgi:hypothetical protein
MKRSSLYTIVGVLILLTTLSACESANSANISKPTAKIEDEQNLQTLLSYEQFINMVDSVKNQLTFSTVPMKLTKSSLDKPTIIHVSKDMSFGEKEYLSLDNAVRDSTQFFLSYADEENGYMLNTGWIYTDVYQGNHLLYFKPDVEGNTGDFDSILSYKNILIHLQLTSSKSSSPSSEDFVRENEAVLQDLVRLLEKKS